MRTALPEVRQVTNIRTMCVAFNKTPVTKTLLGEVHKLLRMYLTLPVASATSERTFSALRRLKNYLRSTMKQDRLNNCVLMHCHKSITDTRLVPTNNAKGILVHLSRGMRMPAPPAPPPPPPRFKTLRRLCNNSTNLPCFSGKIEKFRPLPEPIRLHDLQNSARSRTEKK